jgi:hypothetical protein
VSLRLSDSSNGLWLKTGRFTTIEPPDYLDIGDKTVSMREAVEAIKGALDSPDFSDDTAINGLKAWIGSMLKGPRESRGAFSYSGDWLQAHPNMSFPDPSSIEDTPTVEIIGYEVTKPDLMWLVRYVMTNTEVEESDDPRLQLVEYYRTQPTPINN